MYGPNEGNGERIVDLAQAAGVLAHAVVVAEMAKVAERDVGKHGPFRGAELADDRAERRHVLRSGGRLDAEDGILRMRVARQGQVGADGVIVVAMGDGSNDGVAFRQRGEPGQVFADGDARHGRGDRA